MHPPGVPPDIPRDWQYPQDRRGGVRQTARRFSSPRRTGTMGEGSPSVSMPASVIFRRRRRMLSISFCAGRGPPRTARSPGQSARRRPVPARGRSRRCARHCSSADIRRSLVANGDEAAIGRKGQLRMLPMMMSGASSRFCKPRCPSRRRRSSQIVGAIDQQGGAEAVAQRPHGADVGRIGVHREQALGDQHDAVFRYRYCEYAPCLRVIASRLRRP